MLLVGGVLVLLLAGCAGKTTGATNVTSTGATLNARGSCASGEKCRFYWEYWRAGQPRSTSVRTAPTGTIPGPVAEVSLATTVTGLAAGQTYRWVVCGSANDGGVYACVGPNGKAGGATVDPPSDYSQFTTTAAALPARPALTSLSPGSGSASGGTEVVLSGTNLAGVTAVRFGASAAQVKSNTATAVTVLTPPRAAGTVDVTVTTAGGTSSVSTASRFSYTSDRATKDRPDDFAGAQIHLIYAVPTDGNDRRLDTSGAIATMVQDSQAWMRSAANGRALRFDTSAGRPDISFLRLGATDSQISSKGVRALYDVQTEVRAAGFNAPNKIYEVLYDGGNTASCGVGFWPPYVPGAVVALWLRGASPGSLPCDSQPLPTTDGTPGYWGFVLAHEALHNAGMAPSCAPHSSADGHVSDDNTDLMYTGSQPWYPSVVDAAHDDYFDAGISSCQDLAQSAFFEGGSQMPPGWGASTSVASRAADSATLSRLVPPNPRTRGASAQPRE